MKLTRTRLALTAGLLAVSFALPVLADPPAKGDAPLGGPPVEKGAGKGAGKDGAPGKDGKGGKGERFAQAGATERRNAEAWRRAFESIQSDLTEEQQTKVRSIRQDFETQMRTWKESNADKLKDLTEKLRASKQAAGEGGKPDPAIVKQIQDLEASRPKVTDMQQQAWGVLTTDQQAKFKTNYDAIQKEMEDKKASERGGKRGDGAAGKDPMAPGGDRPAKRPNTGKPFQFDEKDQPTQPKNGDGKPSGS